MSDFKFNFAGSGDEDEQVKEGKNQENTDNDEGPEAKEIPWRLHPTESRNLATVEHRFGSHSLLTVMTSEVEDQLAKQATSASGVAQAIAKNTDLISGQYEGGLKVWECSVDLCGYLVEGDVELKGRRVLELGCGAGLPAMLAATIGATSVHFQDFNSEVLEWYTMKNIELNGIKQDLCRFYSGDWASFASLAEGFHQRYELILTAETIYNVKSYGKLLRVFSSLLAENGMILVAAKNDYFGVGGSVSTFLQFLQEADPQFQVETVKLIDADLPRKILKLTRR